MSLGPAEDTVCAETDRCFADSEPSSNHSHCQSLSLRRRREGRNRVSRKREER